MYKKEFMDNFNWWSNWGVSLTSLFLSVFAIYVTMVERPLIQLVWILLIIPGVSVIIGVYYRIKGLTALEDNRLDDTLKSVTQCDKRLENLIEAVKQLQPLSENLKLNIDCKWDTADVSKMNADQLKVTSEFMNQMPKEK